MHLLHERHVADGSAFSAVDINYATRRARVRWDAISIKLDILAAIAVIGYRAYPYDATGTRNWVRKERRMPWRLWVAGSARCR